MPLHFLYFHPLQTFDAISQSINGPCIHICKGGNTELCILQEVASHKTVILVVVVLISFLFAILNSAFLFNSYNIWSNIW